MPARLGVESSSIITSPKGVWQRVLVLAALWVRFVAGETPALSETFSIMPFSPETPTNQRGRPLESICYPSPRPAILLSATFQTAASPRPAAWRLPAPPHSSLPASPAAPGHRWPPPEGSSDRCSG